VKGPTLALSLSAFSAAGLHFLRMDDKGLFAACLMLPLLFLVRREWARYVLLTALCSMAAMWIAVLIQISRVRFQMDEPWGRFAVIIAAVFALTILAAIFVGRIRFEDSGRALPGDAPAFVAFLITAAFLALARAKAPFTVLLADRAVNGAGWMFILFISAYAAWIAMLMVENRATAKLRLRIWVLFAAVFFAQLFLGLLGFESFLMTGRLHAPVPAVVVAGPLYRGEGFSMLMLFASTILLVGPAWCSHLCYFGAWDALAASNKKRSTRPPAWFAAARPLILALVAAAALLMRARGVSGYHASIAALAFGLAGLGIMAFVSRSRGYMAHCLAWCPLGLLAVLGGRLSPFRIRIDEGCTDCGACSSSCRYDALRPEHIRARSPGMNCTLCGDCLASCRGGFIGYRFPLLSGRRARTAFIVLVVVLHAVFLGFARI